MERRPIAPVHGLLFFIDNRDATLQLRDRVASLLDRLGLGRNPKKGQEGAYTSRRALRPPHRHYHLFLPSPDYETTTRRCNPLPDCTTTLFTRDSRCLLPARQLAVLAGNVPVSVPLRRLYAKGGRACIIRDTDTRRCASCATLDTLSIGASGTVITVDCDDVNCTFVAPRSTAVPTIQTFRNAHPQSTVDV
jgi:hypothetical protein